MSTQPDSLAVTGAGSRSRRIWWASLAIAFALGLLLCDGMMVYFEDRDFKGRDPAAWATMHHKRALALYAGREYSKAAKVLREVVAVRARVLGPENPDIFEPCYNLALSLEALKKNREALAYAHRALDGCEKTLGENNTFTKDIGALVKRLQPPL